MKKNYILIFICFIVYSLSAGSNVPDLPEINYDKLRIGTDETFEIVTWNIQNFPKSEYTVHYAARIIQAIDADVYALQEIEDDQAFFELINELNNIDAVSDWSGFRANSDDWDLNLAFVYKTSIITVRKIFEIYYDEEDHYALPRHPLLMECTYNDQEIVIINNHFKAMPGLENENRRRAATSKLGSYLKVNYPDDKLILLGDLNDILTDPDSLNVFLDFLKDPGHYIFADYAIAADSTADWSYPYWKYRSHLDHILISDELFDVFNSKFSETRVITIDKFMDGGEEYRYKYITDHRPVALKLKFRRVKSEKR